MVLQRYTILTYRLKFCKMNVEPVEKWLSQSNELCENSFLFGILLAYPEFWVYANEEMFFMRSKKRTVVILIVIIVVLIGIVGGIFILNKHSSQKNEERSLNSNVYNGKVDEAIASVLFSEDYNTLSLDDKKDRMLSVLYQLEKDGEILKDSILYQENVKTIWFKYSDGMDGGVGLEERPAGFSGNADTNKYVVSRDSNGQPSKVNTTVDFSDSSYPFTEEDIKQLNLTAKYMFGLCDINDTTSKEYKNYNDYLKYYRNYQSAWNNQHLKTDIDDYCTVEDFKTSFLGYDIIFIE